MESFILITGLILFSGTVTHDLNNKVADVQKADNTKKVEQVETGFFNLDIKK